jgi:hypothetical protein
MKKLLIVFFPMLDPTRAGFPPFSVIIVSSS